MLGLTKQEEKMLRKLNTPIKIQNFLDTLAISYEKKGETYMSPRRVLREKKARCLEGAMLAATALWLQGQKPLLLDLRTTPEDEDHVVALFRVHGYWGAISKTNHPVLRYRDPVFRTVRELALSYFNEYFMFDTGKKTLQEYSVPIDLSKQGHGWVTAEHELFEMISVCDNARHYALVPKRNARHLRKADAIEIRASNLLEWKRSDPRT